MLALDLEHGFVEELPSTLLDKLANAGRRQRYAKGALIHSRGEPATSVYVVMSGVLKVSRLTAKGVRTTTALLGVGEPLGLLTMLSGQPRSHDAHAATDCGLLVITRNTFFRLLAEEPQLRDRVIALLATRLARALETVDDLKRLPASARLAKLLLERGDENGLLHMTQEAIGDELGVSRNAVGSALRALAVCGAAKSTYGGIQVLDRRVLRAAIGSEM
jgi:CRP-like cAMP-binding protein